MKLEKLKSLYRRHGAAVVVPLLESALNEDGQNRLRPEEFSLQELWETFIGPVKTTLGMGGGSGFQILQEDAVDTKAFADITGVLIANKVIEGYNAPGYIGRRLVTVMPSSRQQERYPGFTVPDGPQRVEEAMPYAETGFRDKYATSEAFKKGRLMNVTEEAILFDQTGQVLMRAQATGEKCRLDEERTILRGILDLDNEVFSPQGVAEALYRTSAGTNSDAITQVDSNELVDWTNIDTALQTLAGMEDENGDEIVVIPRIILAPNALAATLNRILTATQVRHRTDSANIETLSSNPISGLEPITSILLDRHSSSNWFIGDPAKQFVWHQIWPVQVARRRLESDAHVRDIVVSFKVRYYGGIAAIDDKYFVKNEA